jgi:hypothetical protein
VGATIKDDTDGLQCGSLVCVRRPQGAARSRIESGERVDPLHAPAATVELTGSPVARAAGSPEATPALCM